MYIISRDTAASWGWVVLAIGETIDSILVDPISIVDPSFRLVLMTSVESAFLPFRFLFKGSSSTTPPQFKQRFALSNSFNLTFSSDTSLAAFCISIVALAP